MKSLAEIDAVLSSAPGRTEYYVYSIDFTQTIAAAGNGTAQLRLESDSDFIVQAMVATLFTPAAVAPTIAGTPYSHVQGDVTVTAAVGNTFPTMAHFRLQLTHNTRSWFLTPQRVSNICGTAQHPAYLQTEQVIRAGSTLTAQLFNDVAATYGVQGSIGLIGYRLYRR